MGENVREFRGIAAFRESFIREFVRAHAHNTGQSAICESFIREMLNFNQFAKVFTHECFPLYGSLCVELHSG